MSTHTPGPWWFSKGGPLDPKDCLEIGAGNEVIAQVIYNGRRSNLNDARMIAAAPEMYAELERLCEAFGWSENHPACIALARAKGQA